MDEAGNVETKKATVEESNDQITSQITSKTSIKRRFPTTTRIPLYKYVGCINIKLKSYF
jgi:hypothetical protein